MFFYFLGKLAYFGPHHKDGLMRIGVILDNPVGLNNGTIGDEKHKYFTCTPKHGILVDPRSGYFIFICIIYLFTL